MLAMRPPFHLAFPVHDLDAARGFYGGLLGCSVGRTDARWIDFDFFGHQITAHLVDGASDAPVTNAVDGDAVPARHFGVILSWDGFEELRGRLEGAGVRFRIAPHVRFAGQVGEQATMFLDDPSGNVIEVKAFRDPAEIFATERPRPL
jgi:uncharacterized protein